MGLAKLLIVVAVLLAGGLVVGGRLAHPEPIRVVRVGVGRRPPRLVALPAQATHARDPDLSGISR